MGSLSGTQGTVTNIVQEGERERATYTVYMNRSFYPMMSFNQCSADLTSHISGPSAFTLELHFLCMEPSM